LKEATGISASVGAILSSIATIGCCLPLGFAAALGAGVTSAFFTALRPWLLGVSVALLGLGFWQRNRAKKCSIRGRMAGNVLLWAAVVVVVGMTVFTQEIAAFIADRLSGR
jgi:O-antigen ligase